MSPSLEQAFAFLFKYRPVVFQHGDLALGWPRPLVLTLFALVLLAPLALRYGALRGKTRVLDRVVLGILRVAAAGALVFSLAQPALVVSIVVPQQSFVGVLLDDSRSMRIADTGGAPRRAFVDENFGSPEGPLLRALSERFKVRLFRFGGSLERMEVPAPLAYEGAHTVLGRALTRAKEELGAVPLAGLVVLTDGADNGPDAVAEVLPGLKAAGVPVYTVGLGAERHDRDIEVTRIEVPRSVLKGGALVLTAVLAQRGFSGKRVPLVVEEGDRVVSTQDVDLPAEGETAAVRVHLTLRDAGPRALRVRVPAQPREAVTENNARETLVTVADRREKILYFEGEPRFEMKFLRRAVADDQNLQVVTLQRTAKDKFIRFDVDDAEELAAGFPRTREELFRYRGVILGSVEASAFTGDQLRMLVDFVGKRGGGLLMLGGRRSFSEGGYAATPLAEALPVVLEPRESLGASDPPALFAEVKVELTPFGRTQAVLQLDSTEDKTAERWETLPPLSVSNAIPRAKPGAQALLLGRGEGLKEPQVILAHQRYGRGRTLAFTAQDSWQWQMHATIPVEDQTHEHLWQQTLRYLVSQTPGPVRVTTSAERVEPGESVEVRAEVEDDRYLPVNDATVTAKVKGPSGAARDVALEWTVDKDGEYRGRLRLDEKGQYEVAVEAHRGSAGLGAETAFVEAGDLGAEYFGAEMRAPLLRSVAEETGGRFYTPATASRLPEDLSYSPGGTTVKERRDLWDMPALFLVIVGSLCIEWAYRKARGLA